MLRTEDTYFFDVDAFVNIIDYYIDKNDPVKALQVIDFAQQQHPGSFEFMLRKAQLLAMVERYQEALDILDEAEQVIPKEPDLYMIRGSIFSQQERYDMAIESFNKAIPLADELDMLYVNIAKI